MLASKIELNSIFFKFHGQRQTLQLVSNMIVGQEDYCLGMMLELYLELRFRLLMRWI